MPTSLGRAAEAYYNVEERDAALSADALMDLVKMDIGFCNSEFDLGDSKKATGDSLFTAIVTHLEMAMERFHEAGDRCPAKRENTLTFSFLPSSSFSQRPLEEISAALRLAEILTNDGDIGEARKFLTQGLARAEETEMVLMQASCLVSLSALHRIEGAFCDALSQAEQALGLYRQKGVRHKLGQANALLGMGLSEVPMGLEAQASKHLHKALIIYEQECKDPLGQANTHLALGELKRDLQSTKAAESHLEKAKVLYSELKHPTGLANVNLALGELYRSMDRDHEKAEMHFVMALKGARDAGDLLGEANATESLGDFMREKGDTHTIDTGVGTRGRGRKDRGRRKSRGSIAVASPAAATGSRMDGGNQAVSAGAGLESNNNSNSNGNSSTKEVESETASSERQSHRKDKVPWWVEVSKRSMEEAQPKYQQLGCRPGVCSTLLEVAMLKAPHLRKAKTKELRSERLLGGDSMLDLLEEEAEIALQELVKAKAQDFSGRHSRKREHIRPQTAADAVAYLDSKSRSPSRRNSHSNDESSSQSPIKVKTKGWAKRSPIYTPSALETEPQRCPICTLLPPCNHSDPTGKDRAAHERRRLQGQEKQTEYERFYLHKTMELYRETTKVGPQAQARRNARLAAEKKKREELILLDKMRKQAAKKDEEDAKSGKSEGLKLTPDMNAEALAKAMEDARLAVVKAEEAKAKARVDADHNYTKMGWKILQDNEKVAKQRAGFVRSPLSRGKK